MANKGTLTFPLYDSDGEASKLQQLIEWECIPDSINNTVTFELKVYLKAISSTTIYGLSARNDSYVKIYYNFTDEYGIAHKVYSSAWWDDVNSIFEGISSTGLYLSAGGKSLVTSATSAAIVTPYTYVGGGKSTYPDDFEEGPFTVEDCLYLDVNTGQYPLTHHWSADIPDGTVLRAAGSDPIDRRSVITCNTTYIGARAALAITKNQTGHTNTITYSIDGTDLTGTIATKTSATKIYWQIPGDIVNSLPVNATQTTCKISWTTYKSDGTVIGTNTTSFILLVDPNLAAPVFAPEFRDTNETTIALTGDSSVLVKYFSDMYVATNAEAQNGATLVSQSISCGSQTINAGSGTFEKVSSNVFTLRAVDSRGFTSAQTIAHPKVVNYVKLTCNYLVPPPDGSGNTTITLSGNYFEGSFGAVKNNLTLQYRYSTTQGEGTWVTVVPAFSDNTYGIDVDLQGLDYTQRYYFEARAVDALMEVTQTASVIGTPIFDWDQNDFHFNVPVLASKGMEVEGDITLNGASVAGALGMRTHSMEVGTWTPVSAIATTPDAAYGNFILIDNLCIINWYYQCSVTYATNKIVITGLPYEPSSTYRWQSGGGNMSGGTIELDATAFAGWTIENVDGTLGICGRTVKIRSGSTEAITTNSGYIGAKVGNTFYSSGTIMYEVS